MATYEGSCFCGEVKVEVDGEPDAMVVCHCTVCRTWSASPVNGATIFKPENVRIVQGKDKLKSFAKNPGHDRSWCESCGGHVLTCLLYTSPSPRDRTRSRMPSSA